MRPSPSSVWLFACANAMKLLFVLGPICFGISAQSTLAQPLPNRPLLGFHHERWSIEENIGAVFDIQQDSHGFLWITTARGVLRFDGLRFLSVDEVTNGAVHGSDVDYAYAATGNHVWFSTRTGGLLLWNDGHLLSFPDRRCTPSLKTEEMLEDKEGSLWVRASTGLFRLRGTSCERVEVVPGESHHPSAVFVDRAGSLWVKLSSGAVYMRSPGQTAFERNELGQGAPGEASSFQQAPDGTIWLSDSLGLRKISGTTAIAGTLPRRDPSRFGNFKFAPDGSLWAASSKGVQRFEHPERLKSGEFLQPQNAETFAREQGLTSSVVWKVFLDLEGDVWFGTESGLDKLRRDRLSTVSIPESREGEIGLAARPDGGLWIGSRALPLTAVAPDGTMTPLSDQANILSIHAGRDGALWWGDRQSHRLWRRIGSQITSIEAPSAAIADIAVDRNGDPWISTFGPIYRMQAGHWVDQNNLLERKSGVVGSMGTDPQENVWIAFSNKLVRWDGRQFQRFAFPEGSLNISVTNLAFRQDRVWLGGTGGVVLFRAGKFQLLRWQDPGLPGRISGVVETRDGDLWLNSFSGVTHVSAAEVQQFFLDPNHLLVAEHFDISDGLPGYSVERYPNPSLVETETGRLWFATSRGLAWLDPAVLEATRNRNAPPVVIDSLIAGGKVYVGRGEFHLPARTSTLQLDYTALSLAQPRRVLFRYRMDGYDKDWQDAGARRQAFYTNLSPGHYQFHVIACNGDGVWNDAGATLGFVLAPALYQTWWFRIVCLALLLATVAWIMHLRVESIARELRSRMAERSSERESIARELHDTLLQSLYGLMLQLQSSADRLPADDPTRGNLLMALSQAEEAMHEGRERVEELRDRTTSGNDLVSVISDVGRRLEGLYNVRFECIGEDTPPMLIKVAQEEMLSVALEALNNAFRHAQAKLITVRILYRTRFVRLTVDDDGSGISDEKLGADGRSGHWGITGMQERANKIGGNLQILRKAGSGTCVDLHVPASVAYANRKRSVFKRLLAGA